MQTTRRFLGVFLLAMLNLSVMTSLRNLPIVAEYGYGCALLYLLIACLFLFPSAFISAELATGWMRTGGVYVWVREAFGPGWGFFAIWMQWIHNVTWFPAILSFVAATFAFLLNVLVGGGLEGLSNHKGYLLGMILIGFWGFTFFNYFGLKHSSWFSAIGVICGTVIPGVLLITLVLLWVGQGKPLQIDWATSGLVPPLGGIRDWVFITGLFLAFGGMEVSAAHIREVKDPQKTFPRAILTAALIALLIYVCGALSIALIIPQEKISLVTGLMEAFEIFLQDFGGKGWIVPIGLMIILGAIGELNAWIIGPVRSLHATSKHGDLPLFFQKLNSHGMPTRLLFFQAVVVSLASLVFLWMPSASSAFWILSAMSAQLYLLMYILMFLSAIKLRYSHPDVPRAYRIPYRMPGIWFVGSLGALSCLAAFFLGFIPPAQIEIGNLWFYELFLVGGILGMCLIPYGIYRCRRPNWKVLDEKIE